MYALLQDTTEFGQFNTDYDEDLQNFKFVSTQFVKKLVAHGVAELPEPIV